MQGYRRIAAGRQIDEGEQNRARYGRVGVVISYLAGFLWRAVNTAYLSS